MKNIITNIAFLFGSKDRRLLDFSVLYATDNNLARIIRTHVNDPHTAIFDAIVQSHTLGLTDDDEHTALMAYATILWRPILKLYALTHKQVCR